MHGINAKRWFYGLKKTLDRRSHVLAGAASELWLAGELSQVVASGLSGAMTVLPEFGKNDIVVVGLRDREPVAVLEAKLVYVAYSPAKIAAYISRLVAQMQVARRRAPYVVGLVVAVYNEWPWQTRRLTFEAFRERVLRAFRRSIAGTKVMPARDTLETFTELRQHRVGGAHVKLGVAAQYLMLR